ncbi:hypothetical protein AC520_1876B, partial [Enterobacter sp. OLF]
ITETAQN